jgi:outer membrane protein OmpA-like peptidoglycan-associated protein
MWRDRDGDGIPDEDDQCPDVPEDKDGFQDDDGCPDPDNDKDGVPDAQDKCPLVPGLASNEGCPDSDNDGIPDHLDKCPKQPGLKKYDGCPDSDDDGVPDPDDQCPQKKGPKEYDGCPDSDGDEIPDKDDSCPKEPGPAKNKGCPLQEPAVALEQGQLVLKDTIHFDTDKATIKKASFPVLDELVRILNEHPEIEKVLIEGHTDNVGSDAYNLDLSQRRAEALVKYLIEKGIAKSRLSAQGFGFHRPIAPNITAMGRALNRRVEFSISE